MKIVKYLLMALGAVGLLLSFVHHLQSYGGHGITVIVCLALPVLLGALGSFALPSMPRWASGLSMLAFLVAAMKTRGGSELENIMMVAAFGFVAALALAIRPDRPTAAYLARRT